MQSGSAESTVLYPNLDVYRCVYRQIRFLLFLVD